MAQIVNLTSFAGSDGDSITAADAGWVKHPSYSAGEMLVYQGRARQGGASTKAGFYRSESPSSANQTVTASIYTASQSTVPVGIACRMSASANEMILAQYLQGQIKLFKFLSGSATEIGSAAAITNPATGLSAELQLDVSGQSPNISIVVRYNGAAVINRPSENIPALDAVGRVGIRVGTGTISNNTMGYHIASFAASDDSSDPTPPTGTTTITDVSPGTTSALVTYSYSAGDATGFEYRLNGGTAASIGASPATISGLTASTPYSLEVRAINAAGSGSWSAVYNFTTSAEGPGNLPPSFDGPNIAAISATEGVALSALDVSSRFSDAESALTFSAVGSWPDGVTVSSAGVISGTPTTAGTYSGLQVRATDAGALPADSNTFSITVAAAALPSTITVTEPLKNNTGTTLANRSGVGVAFLRAEDFTYGLTTDASGILAPITDAAIVTGQQYHVVIKLADGSVGITGPITAS